MPAENILCYSTACCHMNVHNKPTTQWISVLVCSCDFTICVSVSVRLQNKQSNCVRVQFKASTELCRNIDWVSFSKSNKKKKSLFTDAILSHFHRLCYDDNVSWYTIIVLHSFFKPPRHVVFATKRRTLLFTITFFSYVYLQTVLVRSLHPCILVMNVMVILIIFFELFFFLMLPPVRVEWFHSIVWEKYLFIPLLNL